jgi:hypothetical protein
MYTQNEQYVQHVQFGYVQYICNEQSFMSTVKVCLFTLDCVALWPVEGCTKKGVDALFKCKLKLTSVALRQPGLEYSP